jgi:flavin reductase (DIM6/NTAB) family NADH-FMN oxidoreductase RutF
MAAGPPTIMIIWRNGPERDNGKDNFQTTKRFVVNIISEPRVNQEANMASIDAPEDENGASHQINQGAKRKLQTIYSPTRPYVDPCKSSSRQRECF